MPSPLGWTLIALVLTCFLALRRRRRTPLRLADGAPLPDEFDWAAFARGAREVAERARRPNRERPMALMAEWDLELVGPDGAVEGAAPLQEPDRERGPQPREGPAVQPGDRGDRLRLRRDRDRRRRRDAGRRGARDRGGARRGRATRRAARASAPWTTRSRPASARARSPRSASSTTRPRGTCSTGRRSRRSTRRRGTRSRPPARSP